MQIICLLKVDVFLVDAEIGQMHKLFGLLLCAALLSRTLNSGVRLVFARCKTSQTIFVDVKAKGVYRGDRYVDSKVKFVPIEKQRAVNVFADHKLFVFVGNLAQFIGHKDATPLR